MEKIRGRQTAAEIAAELEKDPEYIAMRTRKEQELAAREAMLREDEQPLVSALRDVGLDVDSVWDLVNTSIAYPEAIPTLLEHLQRPYHPTTREGIARALTVRSAKGIAWNVLLREFLKENDRTTLGPKWAMANALSYIAEKSNVDTILELVQDKQHGGNRSIIVDRLPRFPEPRVVQVLEQLTHDEEVSVRAEKALNKIRKRLERKSKV